MYCAVEVRAAVEVGDERRRDHEDGGLRDDAARLVPRLRHADARAMEPGVAAIARKHEALGVSLAALAELPREVFCGTALVAQ